MRIKYACTNLEDFTVIEQYTYAMMVITISVNKTNRLETKTFCALTNLQHRTKIDQDNANIIE